MFKAFYIHNHREPGPMEHSASRGFTLKISFDPNNLRNVIVQGAWCSPKDQFVKAEGRSQAEKAEQRSINKRALPDLLAQMATVCRMWNDQPNNWYYVLKYVV